MFWQSLLKLKAHWSTTSRVRRLTLSNAITGSFFLAKADHLFCEGGKREGGKVGMEGGREGEREGMREGRREERREGEREEEGKEGGERERGRRK